MEQPRIRRTLYKHELQQYIPTPEGHYVRKTVVVYNDRSKRLQPLDNVSKVRCWIPLDYSKAVERVMEE